tara:strand:- start:103 stop:375 length:273 start_codon:yes stop_codon:yes gene_type:complete
LLRDLTFLDFPEPVALEKFEVLRVFSTENARLAGTIFEGEGNNSEPGGDGSVWGDKRFEKITSVVTFSDPGKIWAGLAPFRVATVDAVTP